MQLSTQDAILFKQKKSEWKMTSEKGTNKNFLMGTAQWEMINIYFSGAHSGAIVLTKC